MLKIIFTAATVLAAYLLSGCVVKKYERPHHPVQEKVEEKTVIWREGNRNSYDAPVREDVREKTTVIWRNNN